MKLESHAPKSIIGADHNLLVYNIGLHRAMRANAINASQKIKCTITFEISVPKEEDNIKESTTNTIHAA